MNLPGGFLKFLICFILLPSTSVAMAVTTTTRSNRRRVFFGGVQGVTDKKLSRQEFESRVRSVASIYGGAAPTELFVPDRTTGFYAIVSFEDPTSVEKLLEQSTKLIQEHHEWLGKVGAKQVNPRKDLNLNKFKKQGLVQYEHMKQMTIACNVVVQLPHVFVDRLIDLIESESTHVKVLGSTRTNSKGASLIFLNSSNPEETSSWLGSTSSESFLSIAIRQVYVVQSLVDHPSSMTVDEATGGHQKAEEDQIHISKRVERYLQSHSSEISSSIVDTERGEEATTIPMRLKVFPPRLQQELLLSLPTTISLSSSSMNNAKKSIAWDPKNALVFLNVVEILPSSQFHPGIHAIGISRTAPNPDPSNLDNQITKPSVIICRAQSKLQEVWTRYPYPLPSGKDTLKALDVGASPGGWTWFMASRVKHVTSIDPGALDPQVLALENVSHISKRIEDYLDDEKNENGDDDSKKVDIWVSDMCLQRMEAQVDWLLKAKECGVVGSGTFFVLTLKCILGHSKHSYDPQVKAQVDRLKGVANLVHSLHLMANKAGERTIMGYLI